MVAQNDLMKEQSETMQKQLIEMEKQAEISHQQSEAMRESLAQTENLFNLTERPLLGVEEVYCEPQPDEGCKVIIALVNSGKTMAKITNLSIDFGSMSLNFDSLEDIPEDLTLREPEEPQEFLTSGIIHNGGRKLIPYATLNAGKWDNVQEGDERIFVYMKIQYTGIHGGGYFTEYYAYYNTFLGGFIECADHNDAD